MRLIKSLTLAIALSASAVSYAYPVKDVEASTIINEHQKAVQKHADSQNKDLPTVIQYRYGMKLDIARVVHKSPSQKLCKIMPQLMTYEDSKGEWNTIQYKVLGSCPNKNG